MNISPVSFATMKPTKITAPSFGLARLSRTGREVADSFSFRDNAFLNPGMFEKQGIFKDAAIVREYVDVYDSFVDLCTDYGCSTNPKANASFIKNQILSKKGRAALKQGSKQKQELGYASLSKKEYQEGLRILFENNFDNPELSLEETKDLLELIKESLKAEDYVKYAGVLEVKD